MKLSRKDWSKDRFDLAGFGWLEVFRLDGKISDRMAEVVEKHNGIQASTTIGVPLDWIIGEVTRRAVLPKSNILTGVIRRNRGYSSFIRGWCSMRISRNM